MRSSHMHLLSLQSHEGQIKNLSKHPWLALPSVKKAACSHFKTTDLCAEWVLFTRIYYAN